MKIHIFRAISRNSLKKVGNYMINLTSNKYIVSLYTKFMLFFMGIFSSVFINRYLGPTLKGEYAFTLNIINIVVLILNLGIYQSYPYFKREFGEDIKSKYINLVFVQFLIYMIIAISVSLIFQDFQLTIISTLTPLMIFTKQLNFIALIENVNVRSKLNIGNQLFYVLFLLLIYIFAPQDILYIFILLYLKDLLIILRIIKKFKFRISLSKIDKQFFISTIKFGVFPMLSALLITFNYNIDIIILKLFVGFKDIGYYSVGISLANQVWLIPDAFKEVLFSKTAKNDAIDDIKMSIKVNLYISLIIILGVALLGKPLINILFGPEYLPSYSVTVVIFAGLIPMVFYKMIVSLFNVKGKQRLSFWILLLSAVINISMNFALIPHFGIIGAAAASVLSYSVCGIFFTYIFMRDFNVQISQLFILSKDEMHRIRKILFKNQTNNVV